MWRAAGELWLVTLGLHPDGSVERRVSLESWTTTEGGPDVAGASFRVRAFPDGQVLQVLDVDWFVAQGGGTLDVLLPALYPWPASVDGRQPAAAREVSWPWQTGARTGSRMAGEAVWTRVDPVPGVDPSLAWTAALTWTGRGDAAWLEGAGAAVGNLWVDRRGVVEQHTLEVARTLRTGPAGGEVGRVQSQELRVELRRLEDAPAPSGGGYLDAPRFLSAVSAREGAIEACRAPSVGLAVRLQFGSDGDLVELVPGPTTATPEAAACLTEALRTLEVGALDLVPAPVSYNLATGPDGALRPHAVVRVGAPTPQELLVQPMPP